MRKFMFKNPVSAVSSRRLVFLVPFGRQCSGRFFSPGYGRYQQLAGEQQSGQQSF